MRARIWSQRVCSFPPPSSPSNTEEHPEPALLTLGEIIRDVRLSDTRLVVLSTCETGVVNVEDRHEECFGLPAGFLLRGGYDRDRRALEGR